MNKLITIFMALILGIGAARAQNDTTIVHNVTFSKEVYTSKTNETKEYYYASHNGKIYKSNKTSYQRNKQYNRLGIKPTYVLITSKKSKRIIIL